MKVTDWIWKFSSWVHIRSSWVVLTLAAGPSVDLFFWKCNCVSAVGDGVSTRQFITVFGRDPTNPTSTSPYHPAPTIPHCLHNNTFKPRSLGFQSFVFQFGWLGFGFRFLTF